MSDSQKKTLLEQFGELGKEAGLNLDTFTVNGQFVNFTSRETDNMWLGFCMAHGGLDLYNRAIERSSNENIERLLTQKVA